MIKINKLFKFVAIICVSSIAISLSACSSSGTSFNHDVNKKAINITGEFAQTAEVEILDDDLNVDRPDIITLIEGTGDSIRRDARLGLALYSPIDEEYFLPYTSSFSLTYMSDSILLLEEAADGLTFGTRAVLVASSYDMFGEGVGKEYFGVKDDDPLVLVIDIIEAVQTSDPETTDDFKDSDFPNVTFDENGEPIVEITTGVTPSATKYKILKEGAGDEVVEEGDTISAHYQLVRLRDGEVMESVYSETLDLVASTDALIVGFANSLFGQKAGTTLLLVVPPSEGYGSTLGSLLEHETLVFVIDIVSITKASDTSEE